MVVISSEWTQEIRIRRRRGVEVSRDAKVDLLHSLREEILKVANTDIQKE
jgi:hypothetical protein